MIPFELKIACFYLAIFLLFRYLKHHPDTLLYSLAFSWYGPIPNQSETKSSYLFRQGVYALSWFLQLSLVFSCGVLSIKIWPNLLDTTFFAVAGFAMMFFFGMSLLGSLIAFFVSFKLKVFNPYLVFDEQLGEFVDDRAEKVIS